MALWLKILIWIAGIILILGAIILALISEPDEHGIIRIKID